MKNKLRKIYWFMSNQLGLDPRRLFRSLRGVPRYATDVVRFRRRYKGPIEWQPCLYDWFEEGGSATSEYFLQDLYVAQKIQRSNPNKHVDIGSRVDGFVAHIASFREIEVFDIRAMTSTLPGIVFRQADLMNPTPELDNYCDSLSCLHALEHFGLGRYGDTLEPQGSEIGFRHMAQIVKPGGKLYLSVPLGIERIVFNAHRVFAPRSIMAWARLNGLNLREFAVVQPGKSVDAMADWENAFNQIEHQTYTLGIFTFERTHQPDGPG